MSIINRIPENSRVRFPVVRFQSANLNGLGQYDFGTAANLKAVFMSDMNPQAVYVFTLVNFFANVAEADWLSSMLTAPDFPRISLQYLRIGGASIYGEPFRAVNYVDNSEQLIYTRPQQKGDIMGATMFGLVQQVPAMIGNVFLVAQFNATVYEVTDRDWIREYERNPVKARI